MFIIYVLNRFKYLQFIKNLMKKSNKNIVKYKAVHE